MNYLYKYYIERKLSNFSEISQIEKDASWVADRCPQANGVCLLELSKSSYSTFQCNFIQGTQGKRKVTVTEISDDCKYKSTSVFIPNNIKSNMNTWRTCISEKNGNYKLEVENNKKLNDLIETLDKAVESIPQTHTIVAVQGLYRNVLPLLYVLQKKFEKVIVIPDINDYSSYKNRSFISPELINSSVKIGPQGLKLYQAFKLRDPVFVPLHETSLDSVFFENTTWRQLVGKQVPDIEIAGIGMKFITFRFNFDAFQNVFVQVQNADSTERHIVWVHPSTLMHVEMPNGTAHRDSKSNTANFSEKNQHKQMQVGQPNGTGHLDAKRDVRTSPHSQHVESHNTTGTSTEIKNDVYFSKIKLDFDKMKMAIQKKDTEEMKMWISRVDRVEHEIYSMDRILCDTNLFVSKLEGCDAKKMRYEPIITRIATEICKLKASVMGQNNKTSSSLKIRDISYGYPIIEIHKDVYEEIIKLTKQNSDTAAVVARNYICDMLLQLHVFVIPEVRDIPDFTVYADPSLKGRAKELCDKELKVCVLSDDNDALIRIAADINYPNLLCFKPCNLSRMWSLSDKMNCLLNSKDAKKQNS